MAGPHGGMPRACGSDASGQLLEIAFDITVVGGAEGRRLAVLQAEAILDVLTWLQDHAKADDPEGAE